MMDQNCTFCTITERYRDMKLKKRRRKKKKKKKKSTTPKTISIPRWLLLTGRPNEFAFTLVNTIHNRTRCGRCRRIRAWDVCMRLTARLESNINILLQIWRICFGRYIHRFTYIHIIVIIQGHCLSTTRIHGLVSLLFSVFGLLSIHIVYFVYFVGWVDGCWVAGCGWFAFSMCFFNTSFTTTPSLFGWYTDTATGR